MREGMDSTRRTPGLFWLVTVSAILGALAVWNFTGRARSPRLTHEVLATAKTKWHAAGIRDYSMTVVVKAREDAQHEVEVRGGKVSRMLTDSVEAPERVWDAWSVDGLLFVLEEEMANAQRPEGPFGVTNPADVFLDATFDGANGLPLHYLRQVSGNSKGSLEWEIRDFKPLK